ncbi:MAG: winged helix-turn-helix transcriptional regulator [Promethearchaeota archaeon]
MEKILPFIITRFRSSKVNINKKGIEIILKSLLKKKMIYEGSKLNREDLLNNLNRKMIYNYILNNPGTYLNNIVKNLGLSNHVVIWHLNFLLKFNYIRKETINNQKIYFTPNLNFKEVKKRYLSSKEKSQKILNYLKYYNKGVTKTKLSVELKIHPNTLSKYLESLEKLNLIVKEKLLKKTLYFLKRDENSVIHK